MILRTFTLNVWILLLALLLSGCSTSSRTRLESQFPLQVGSKDVYQYYEGSPLPLEEVAIIDVQNPLGILKQVSPMALTAKKDYYYSGKFALRPGAQIIPLSYFQNVGPTSYSSKPVGVPLNAKKGSSYRTFYVKGSELYEETNDERDMNRLFVEIYDVTDREALSEIVNSGRLEAFRREAETLLQQLDNQTQINVSDQRLP